MAITAPEKAAASGILSPELRVMLKAYNISDEVIGKFEIEKILSLQEAREVFNVISLADIKAMDLGLSTPEIARLKAALAPPRAPAAAGADDADEALD